MTTPPPSLEYSPEALEGGVTVRRTDHGVMISLRWSTDHMLMALIAPSVLMLIALLTFYFLYWIPRRAGTGSVGGLTIPVIFLFGAFLQIGVDIFAFLFPVTIEVNAEFLTLRWRAFTTMRSLVWPRAHIRGITLERLRPKNAAFKRWYLVLQQLNAGNVGVICASRAQLELIAKVLREILSLFQNSHPALRIDAPKGCRYKRLEWGGGILLVIPPRRQGIMIATASCACMALSGGLAGFLAWIKGWDEFSFGGLLLFVLTGLMIGALLFIMMCEGLKKMGRRTTVLISPMIFQVIQSGLMHPLNVIWKPDQIKEVTVLETLRNTCSLQLIPHEGLPLIVAECQRPEDVRWAAAVLNACLAVPTLGSATADPLTPATPGG